MTFDTKGISMCARYAFAPNWYHFCGPEKQNDLKAYIRHNVADWGLSDILHHFETLYPYLVLIASENRIKDPFNRRVVEAYWIGNTLLSAVGKSACGRHYEDVLQLKKKIPKKEFSSFMEHVICGVPNHNFHVMNVFIRTGHQTLTHTIQTIDSCRISWGQVVDQVSSIKTIGDEYYVKTKPLVHKDNKTTLGEPVVKTAMGIGMKPQKGEWVSLHWGYMCETLGPRQLKQLEQYTAYALGVANRQRQ
jgi:hypothetical protein